ncbi:hypothetical protein KR044_010515 [Drosophila immigrans]|nr:hypothetical protein KR044_010515 [Drosophila immigrans]
MKWFNLFLLLGVLALVGGIGTMAAAEPLPQPGPQPRGRPNTTRRPKNENNDDRR